MGRHAVLSALVIGSVTPDLWYFQPFGVSRAQSHSVAGLLWFCLPLGLFLYLLFHAFLKRPLLALMPPPAAERLASFTALETVLPPVRWVAVIASLLAGTATHLAWDAFTHYDSVVAEALPLLRGQVLSIGQYELHGYSLLQHLSTLLGIALLLRWAGRAIRRAPVRRLRLPLVFSSRQRSLIFAVIALLIAWTTAAALLAAAPAGDGLVAARALFRHTLVGAGAGVGAAVLAYSLFWHLCAWRTPAKESPSSRTLP
jgi:hypothetical protein